MHKGFSSIVLLLIVLAAVIGFWFYKTQVQMSPFLTFPSFLSHSPAPVACTMEAKLCPDGSSVGRSGPNCEFAACPTQSSNTSPTIDMSKWQTYTDKVYGFEIKYPNNYRIVQNDPYYSNNDILLIDTNDGVSYGVVIEVWNTESEYLNKYHVSEGVPLTVKKHSGKIFTLYQASQYEENKQIISSFKFTN